MSTEFVDPLADFRILRAAVDKAIARFRKTSPSRDDLKRLEQSIAELEKLAAYRPSLPLKPVFPPKPDLPSLPAILSGLNPTWTEERARKWVYGEIRRVRRRMKRKLARRGEAPAEVRRLADLTSALGNIGVVLESCAKSVEEVRRWEESCEAARRRWAAELDKYIRDKPKDRRNIEVRRRIVDRIRADFESLSDGSLGVPVRRVPWRLLPSPDPGPGGLERFLALMRRTLVAHPGPRIEERRLRFAYGLKPSAIYCGTDEFDGYLAFILPNSSRVLLECPIAGNAAYVFGADWKALSKLSKSELLRSHPEEIGRVVHDSGRLWQWKLSAMLCP